jgi:hypothetical protein
VEEAAPHLRFQHQQEGTGSALLLKLDCASLAVQGDACVLSEGGAEEPKGSKRKRPPALSKGAVQKYLKQGEDLGVGLQRWSRLNNERGLRSEGCRVVLKVYSIFRSRFLLRSWMPQAASLVCEGATYCVGGRYNKFARNMPQSAWVVRGQVR